MVMKRSRSSSGTAVVGRLREHAAVEREDAELAVEELRAGAGFGGSSAAADGHSTRSTQSEI